MAKFFLLSLFVVIQACSSPGGKEDSPEVVGENREPRTIDSPGGYDAQTIVTGRVQFPANHSAMSAAGIHVFVDGNASLQTETDASGVFTLVLPDAFVKALPDSNDGIGIVVETNDANERLGLRRQVRKIIIDEKVDSGIFAIELFGKVTGHINLYADGKRTPAAAGVDIFSHGGSFIVQTDKKGSYSLSLPVGDWKLVAYFEGYETQSRILDVSAIRQRNSTDFLLFAENELSGSARIDDGNSATAVRTVTLKMRASARVRGMRISETAQSGFWQDYVEVTQYEFSDDDKGKMELYITFSDSRDGKGNQTDEIRVEILYGPAVIAHYGVDAYGSPPFQKGSPYFSTTQEQRYNLGRNWHPVALTTGDFNGDGYLDIVVVNDSEQLPYVFLNSQDGFKFERIAFATNALLHATSVVSGDFNRDGIDDIVIGYTDAWAQVFYGDKDAVFASTKLLTSTQAPVEEPVANFVAAHIFDSNVGVEVIISYDAPLIPEIQAFASVDTYTAKMIGNESYRAESIFVGSFSEAEQPDIVFSNPLQFVSRFKFEAVPNDVSRYENSDDNIKVTDIGAGDFDGDGNLDLIFAKVNDANDGAVFTDNVAYVFGSGQGTITFPDHVTSGTLVRILDMNNDDFDDCIVTGGERALTLHISQGREGFLEEVRLDANSMNTTGLVIIDINKDGALDIIESFEGGGSNAGSVAVDHKLRIIPGLVP